MDSIDISRFKFQYLPDYAKFLLENKLEEFGMVGIRFAREMNLPMMRPLAKIPEQQLIETARESNREILEGLAANNIVPFIKKNIQNYINNQIMDKEGNILLDKSEVMAEDIIMAFYLRRKVFSFFLYAYTQNAVVHMLIASEVDAYTSQEHLITTKAMIGQLKVPATGVQS